MSHGLCCRSKKHTPSVTGVQRRTKEGKEEGEEENTILLEPHLGDVKEAG